MHDCSGASQRHAANQALACSTSVAHNSIVKPSPGLKRRIRSSIDPADGLAGELGFEPRQTESEAVVLPLHHSPPKWLILQHFFRKFSKIAKEFSKSSVWQR